jgi:hypothetical protein
MAKTSKGGFADYSTSKWSRRERALSDGEQAALSAHGLHNLSDFLPKKPSDVELKVIKEMFEASVDGEAYDAERWSQYFRPAGLRAATGDPVAPIAAPVVQSAPVAQTATVVEDAPFDADPAPVAAPTAAPAAAAGDNSRAQDILAMIRNRQK